MLCYSLPSFNIATKYSLFQEMHMKLRSQKFYYPEEKLKKGHPRYENRFCAWWYIKDDALSWKNPSESQSLRILIGKLVEKEAIAFWEKEYIWLNWNINWKKNG